MKGMTLDLIEREKEDLKEAAYHEAGHYIVAEYYKLEGIRAKIFKTIGGGIDNRFYRGQCGYHVLSLARLTPYKRAVMSWAGIVAEGLAENWITLDEWRETLEDVYYCHEGGDDMSPSDWAGIEGYPNIYRTFNASCRIIEKRYERLLEVAFLLMDEAIHTPTEKIW